jgi:ferredoxin
MTGQDAPVRVDTALCEGTGFCAQIAPRLFALDGPPPAQVVATTLSEQDRADAEEAEMVCPTRAISLTSPK